MKVGHKKRRGRKRNPVPHKPHRTARGAIADPISRSMKVERLRQREEKRRPRWGDDEDMAA
jgi:hypothetical protein